MHDENEGVAGRLAEWRLGRILDDLGDTLADAPIPPEVVEEIVIAVAWSYQAGHRDGQREAVAQIAPEAAAVGLELHLSPDLEDPPERLI
jgi:hypothetical protein